MKYKYKLDKSDDNKVGWEGWEAWPYSSKEDFKRASALYIEVEENHGMTKALKSDRVYLVLGGKGEFKIKDTVRRVKEGDVIIVPRNTPYDYKKIGDKTLRLFLVHAPAFNPKFVIDLERGKK